MKFVVAEGDTATEVTANLDTNYANNNEAAMLWLQIDNDCNDYAQT